jgi:hypothetical protein
MEVSKKCHHSPTIESYEQNTYGRIVYELNSKSIKYNPLPTTFKLETYLFLEIFFFSYQEKHRV